VLTEGHGVPIGLTVEGANRTDMKLVRSTIENIVIDRPMTTEEHPQEMCLDKGYDYEEVCDILHEFGFTAYIRKRGEEVKAIRREAGFKARQVGRGARSFLDESLPPLTHTLGQKPCQLSGFSPFRLCLDHFPVCRVIRIGS
jgi:hypothetical protein